MAFRGRGTIIVSTAAPTASVDIGDAFITGGSGLAADAQHQHAVPAPAPGSTQDLAAVADDGADTTPARSRHKHRHRAVDHGPGGFADLSALFTSPAEIFYNAKRFGAAADGVSDDAPEIQAAIDAAHAAGGGIAYLPAGVYAIGATLKLPDNVGLLGAGMFTSVLKALSSLPDQTAAPFTGLNVAMILTNSDWVGGNSGITVEGVGFDISAKGRGSDHCVHFRNVAHLHELRCASKGGGDGFAHTLCTDFVVAYCYTTAHINCHIDMWDGCHDGLVIGNRIDGTGATNLNSILVTGLDTGTSASPSTRVQIIGNRIANTKGGIWLQGGVIGGATGTVQDCKVLDNIINGTTVNHAIRASEGLGHEIAGNTILNAAQCGVILVGEAAGGAATDCDIHDNTIRGGGSNTTAAIDLGDGATSCNVHHNRVYGAGNQYGVACRAGATGNKIDANMCDAGVTGRILLGTGNTARGNPGFNPVGVIAGAPALPASGVAATNNTGFDATVFISGGTVTGIAVGGSAGSATTGVTAGAVRVPAGATISVVYSVAPTWTWFGD